jgi:hypothetical protein
MNRFAKARLPHPDDAVPAQMPDRALDCAIAACKGSVHASDRAFAAECERELRKRMATPDWTIAPMDRRTA